MEPANSCYTFRKFSARRSHSQIKQIEFEKSVESARTTHSSLELDVRLPQITCSEDLAKLVLDSERGNTRDAYQNGHSIQL